MSGRLVSVTIKLEDGPMEVVQVYFPDSSYSDEEYQEHLSELQGCVNVIAHDSRLAVIGDLNPSVSEDILLNLSDVVGRYGRETAATEE